MPRLWAQGASGVHFSVAEFDRQRTLVIANNALSRQPVTLLQSKRPAGKDPQQFYSEMPPATRDSDAPAQGPEAAGNAHATALWSMANGLSALVGAWRLTGDDRYFNAASAQMRAWFVDANTCMRPTLETAGTVPGIEDNRNNGLRETVVLADCARALAFLCTSPHMPQSDAAKVRTWFADLLTWFTDSKKGRIARQTKTLDAICWSMQAAEFARFTRNDTVFRECGHAFKDGLLRQMSFDGNFPLALREQNPYAASMFTLECMAATCESLSTPFESMWKATLPDGRGMHSAVAWATPYLRDRAKWPYVADRQHFGDEPVRQNALLFAGRAYDLPEYTDLWKTLRPDVPALERDHPISQPALWATRPPA